MKESFDALVQALQKNREKCPWAKDQTLEAHAQELYKEIEEIKQAIANSDDDNLKEEMGDAFMDLLFMAIIAEQHRRFTVKDMIEEVTKKLVRRKPWVFGDMQLKSKEEATVIWNSIKEQEKREKKERQGQRERH
ncbi:nucleotide pyrophosphohydrolase [Candidatus Woesearchaeota archaeon]|nr:nucleotide pyrophosphohydrolase [Candidatus Woesearchaeota archaeon]